MKKVAYIYTTSFRMAFNGEHYYAEVFYGDNRDDIEHPITQQEADYLNKKDGCDDDSFFQHTANNLNPRFESKEEAIECSVKHIHKKYPAVDIILVGNPADADPQPVAWTNSDNLTKILQTIYENYRASDIYHEMERFEALWDKYLE